MREEAQRGGRAAEDVLGRPAEGREHGCRVVGALRASISQETDHACDPCPSSHVELSVLHGSRVRRQVGVPGFTNV
jgi:hypothetical protein